MQKERLKTRKLHSKLIEFQLLESVLLIFLFVLSYDIAWGVIYKSFSPFLMLDQHMRHVLIFVLIIMVLGFYKYLHLMDQPYAEVVRKIAAAGFLLNIFFIMLIYFSSNMKLSISYFAAAYLLQIALFILLRVLADLVRVIMKKKKINLLIIKDFNQTSFIKDVQKSCKGNLIIVTFENENLKDYVEWADNIYLAYPVTKELKKHVLSYSSLEGKRVYILPEIFEIAVKKSSIKFIGDNPVFSIENFQLTEAQIFVKRLMDVVLALIGIVVSLPIFLIAFISIKLEDNGPVFYKQERAGLDGELFEVIKFRSMVVDAEKNTGAVLATENDQRITRIGSFMRSTRIDEIPQFFNVLAGDMSLVGPRPERPVFIDEYNKKYPEYHYRLSVKPGITGLAQVKGNYTTTAENKMKFDLMYIINYSLLLDLKILFQTVRVVLKREQAKGFAEADNVSYFPAADSIKNDKERKLMPGAKVYEHQ